MKAVPPLFTLASGFGVPLCFFLAPRSRPLTATAKEWRRAAPRRRVAADHPSDFPECLRGLVTGYPGDHVASFLVGDPQVVPKPLGEVPVRDKRGQRKGKRAVQYLFQMQSARFSALSVLPLREIHLLCADCSAGTCLRLPLKREG